MADTTGIAWTRSTFNPWIGCTEVSPGCDGCYARVLDERHRYGGATHWGAGVPRLRTTESNWAKPKRWNRLAEAERQRNAIMDGSDWHTPGFWPVFPSMCDPFDNEVPEAWRHEFWELIYDTPNLTWLLLTKRIGNALSHADYLPWVSDPKNHDGPWPWVWIGASVVNQTEADRDLPKLLAVPAAKRFVSYEPALGPIDFNRFLQMQPFRVEQVDDGRPETAHKAPSLIHQVIVGGESSQGKHAARPFNMAWARATRDACRAHGVAFFMKQTGSVFVNEHGTWRPATARAGTDAAQWPQDLRIQEFPA